MAFISFVANSILKAADLNFDFQSVLGLLDAQYTSISLSGTTFAAGQLTGTHFVVLQNTNAAPGTMTTRTAAQMYTDAAAQVGTSYILRLIQTGAGTMTLAAGSGVTLSGTMTVAQNTTRDFIVTFTSATAATIQCIGTGTIS